MRAPSNKQLSYLKNLGYSGKAPETLEEASLLITAMREEDHSLEEEYLTGTGYFGQLDFLGVDYPYIRKNFRGWMIRRMHFQYETGETGSLTTHYVTKIQCKKLGGRGLFDSFVAAADGSGDSKGASNRTADEILSQFFTRTKKTFYLYPKANSPKEEVASLKEAMATIDRLNEEDEKYEGYPQPPPSPYKIQSQEGYRQ
tara:strand:+ start:1106 stop:1705 length:600 start_codon:yes stop_codon:yes gene_type:complete